MAKVRVVGQATAGVVVAGLALLAPQACGVARADGPDRTATKGDAGRDATAQTRSHVSRAGVTSASAGARAGAAPRSFGSPKPAATDGSAGRTGPASARRPIEPIRSVQTPVLPVATVPVPVSVPVAAAAVADVQGTATPASGLAGDVVVAALPAAASIAPPPMMMRATAMAHPARSASPLANWFSGLPANPFTDFLSGALVIARRDLRSAPVLPANQTATSSLAVGKGSGPVLTSITSTLGSNRVVLTFNGPLRPDTATDLSNYSITFPACFSSPQLVTTSGPAVKILSADYSADTPTSSQVTLTLMHPLWEGVFYRIFVNGSPTSVSGNPNSNPLTGGGDVGNPNVGVVFDGDNDLTACGDFYGQFAVGRQLRFDDSTGDHVSLSAVGGRAINVWRELNGDIDQITALPGATAVSGTVTPGFGSDGTVYVGSVTVPVPSPLNLNGATDNLSSSFVTVPAGGLPAPPPVPTATSPTPVIATSQNLPYTLNISPVSAPGITNLPGLQGSVYAQMAPTPAYPGGLWLVFGGRTNGLHNFSPSGEQSFPPSFQNSSIYVINPVNWQVWSRPWNQTDVPAAVYNSLSSGDQQSYQKGDTLYTMGGYSKPGTVPFTGNVSIRSNNITVTSDVERLAVGQAVSGVLAFPSGQEIFPPGTTITGISGNTITTSRDSEVDAAGASFAASTSDFKTYDTLTALSVTGLVQAIINGGAVNGPANIRQIHDRRVAVTGGGVAQLYGRTYLVFGHNFQGGYNGASANISQVYTDEIRSFRLFDNGRTLAITDYQALRDPVNFRRRDGNLVSVVGDFGLSELAYLGGVFTPGSDGTGYQAPITIGPFGRAAVNASYQQFFNQYTTTDIPLYDPRSRSMFDILFGGISLYSYENGQLAENPNLPWVANVTSLVHKRDGSYQEYMMSPIPAVTPGATGYYGASSAFFGNQALPSYPNGVIPLNRLNGPTVLGYMFGGIYSTVSETTGNTFAATGASNQVFQITLTPTGG